MNLDIRFDFQRRERIGLVEAIWGEDKSVDQLKRLSEEVLSKKEVVFITRITLSLIHISEPTRRYAIS